jgi:PAS domain S-box-containing protein
MKLLAKVAEDRYQSARGLEYDLERCLEQWETTEEIVSFTLGASDVSDQVYITRKLYGRETETAQVLAAFEHMVASGQPALVLVSGESGVGKSVLVHELHRPVLRERGYFISGKFTQYQRDIPYAAIVDACRELVQQMLAEPEPRLAAWRQQLQGALGTHGQMMVDLIPQLELVVGPQPSTAGLAPLEVQLHFQRVFRQFIGLFAAAEHPLLLFLDDVQWADAASLTLIAHVLTHSDTHCLMLIAAYRDNEVTPAHPLMATIDAIGKAVIPQQIHLARLHEADLCQLITDTLHCARADAEPLAAIILRKTNGNALFVNQFLRTLYRDGLVMFDPVRHQWRWDLQRVEAAEVTSNVVEWMSGQISRLPIALQTILRLAACLGHQFERGILAQIADRPSAEIATQVEAAVQLGLLLLVHEVGEEASAERHRMYRWSHDRVQQAAYSLLAPDEKIRVHLRIGRVLVAAKPDNRVTGTVFEIVSHLNPAVALIGDSQECRQLAGLNLMAARRAKRATAYSAARNYAALAVDLLPPSPWEHDYPLALEAYRELIEASFLCHQAENAESLLDELLVLPHPKLERAQLLRLRVLYALGRLDHTRALHAGLEALRLLGVDLPSGRNSWTAEVDSTFAGIFEALKRFRNEDLLDQPMITDPADLATSDLLFELAPVARIYEPDLFTLLVLELMKLSLVRGHTRASAYVYALFAVTVFLRWGEREEVYRFAGVARQLVERSGFPEVASRVNIILGGYVEFWREPLCAIVARIDGTVSGELEHGNLVHAGYNLMLLATRQLASGERLDRIAQVLARASAIAQQTANDLALHALRRIERLVAALRGQPSAVPAQSIDETLAELQSRTGDSVKYAHLAELKRFVLFGDFENALRLARRPGAATMTAGAIMHSMVEIAFYHALIAAAAYDVQDSSGQQETLALLQAEEQRYAHWAQACPANFACFRSLLAAERARLSGDHPQALYRYEQAMAAAVEFGLPDMQGQAAERAAASCEARGCIAQVRAYLEMASTSYAAWGADGKVRQLDAYAARFRDPSLRQPASIDHQERLDVLSVAKASQAISGEIVLEKLLDMLMRVVIQSAGAQKACLILQGANAPFLAAEAGVEAQHVTVRLQGQDHGQDIPASLPESVLNYVRRSREQVLLADAGEPNRFSADPYLLAHRPKSLLCLPILRQGVLIGILYIEHRLVSHAFTPERLAPLRLLSAQAAISLENARLYTELKERESRFRRLAESNIIGVFFWHMDGSISEANEAFLTMIGYTSQDLRENRIRWGDLTPPEYRPADERALDEIRRTGACTSYEKEYRRQDGSRVPILVGGALIEGSQDAGIAFVLDLTERKQAEAERAARKAAEAANEAKSAFLANMSHELRSPLNIMLGFGRFMARHSGLPPAVKEDLSIMLRNGEHLRTLINQVLDLAKVEAGRSLIENSDFDLHRLLDDLADMFAFKAEDIGVLLQFKHNDVPRFIRADPLKLRQVLINLLSNALKFTYEGSVMLFAMPVPGPDGMHVQFRVTDTGVGIGPDELTNLFSSFVQARAGLQAQEGTGLGLAISRGFVHAMGGDIHIESALGEGTTVSFDIPAQVVGAEAAAASTMHSSRRVVAVKSGQSFRILVVDDRQDARQLLSRLLIPLGFEVREAANGQEAVNAWRAWHPHLIWMDLRMPVMDGLEASKRIKATPEGRDTAIVALTASSYEEERADILAAGCDDFLRKPFEENELFGLMQKHLALSFVYEKDDAIVRDARAQIDRALLEALPDDVRRSLEQALIRLDSEALATAIREVPHAPLAHALETLAHEFQYSKMLQLIQGADGKD